MLKALLRKLFNRVRVEHDSRIADNWPDVGEVLTEKWSVAPFQPLERIIRESLTSQSGRPDFIDVSGDGGPEDISEQWEQAIESNPGELIKDVVIDDLGIDHKLAKYDITTRRVIVNRNHPFTEEHGETSEQLRLLRDTALVDLLTDAYMIDLGIQQEQLGEIRDYKDRAFRLVAQVRRYSASQIVSMLTSATSHAKGLERIVGDALEHLGLSIDRLGQSGQPEGVATAVVTPTEGDKSVVYKFTYDAKSSASNKVKTHNVGVSGLKRHREDHEADYTLVIAPQFEDGALAKECEQNQVTPMLAADLGRLVMLTVGFGPINLNELRDVFVLYSPENVTRWVDGLVEDHKNRQHLSMGILIEALSNLTSSNPDRPDMLDASLVAEKCRQLLSDTRFPTRNDVSATVRGLSLMVPNVIGISSSGRDIFLNAPASQIRNAIRGQLNAIPDSMKYGIVRADES